MMIETGWFVVRRYSYMCVCVYFFSTSAQCVKGECLRPADTSHELCNSCLPAVRRPSSIAMLYSASGSVSSAMIHVTVYVTAQPRVKLSVKRIAAKRRRMLPAWDLYVYARPTLTRCYLSQHLISLLFPSNLLVRSSVPLLICLHQRAYVVTAVCPFVCVSVRVCTNISKSYW